MASPAADIPGLLARPIPPNATDEYRKFAEALRTFLEALERNEPDLAKNWAAVMIAEALGDLYASNPTTPGAKSDPRFDVVQNILVAAQEQGATFHQTLAKIRPPGYE